MMGVLAIGFTVIYVVSLFVLSGYFVKRVLNSYMEYNFCGRNLTLAFVVFTYMGTWIGGGTIIGLAGRSYLNGVNQYWLFGISCLAGAFFVFIFLTRIRHLEVMSLGDFYAVRYPEYRQVVRIPVSVAVIIRNVTMIGMQFTALSYMLTYILNLDKNLAVLLTFVIVTGYTSLSGLWGVVLTDVLQGIMQTVGMIILFVLSIRLNGGLDNILSFYRSQDMLEYLTITTSSTDVREGFLFIILLGTFFLIGDQGDWERIFSCKTDKIAFWGYLIPLTVTLILLLLPAYIGAFQKSLSVSDQGPEFILYWFIFEKLGPGLTLFILLSLFSSILSSADSFMLATGIIFSNDIIKGFWNREASDRELIFWTKAGMILAGAIGFAFAINVSDIIYLWVSGISIAMMILLPAYLGAWFSRRLNAKGAIAGMTAAILYSGFVVLLGLEFNLIIVVAGLMMNGILLAGISLLTEAPSKLVTESTYYWSNKFKKLTNIPQ